MLLENPLSTGPSLQNIFGNYQKLEQDFGARFHTLLSGFFPVDFDFSILKLDEILPDLKMSQDFLQRAFVVRKITHVNYDGDLELLVSGLLRLNNTELEGFEFQVFFHLSQDGSQKLSEIVLRIDRGRTIDLDGVAHPDVSFQIQSLLEMGNISE